ncbi:hypothetical protein EVAR_24999_1 [Eumeta japonica]|uniref:Uncharacterized protein n=1 Tax=Eumeta variegata TaxID=151549 RepID=A0A4C1XI94_EUMVA|nr:hypothetical protein EVAR_24999_1 [Eumeta japonica]
MHWCMPGLGSRRPSANQKKYSRPHKRSHKRRRKVYNHPAWATRLEQTATCRPRRADRGMTDIYRALQGAEYMVYVDLVKNSLVNSAVVSVEPDTYSSEAVTLPTETPPLHTN